MLGTKSMYSCKFDSYLETETKTSAISFLASSIPHEFNSIRHNKETRASKVLGGNKLTKISTKAVKYLPKVPGKYKYIIGIIVIRNPMISS